MTIVEDTRVITGGVDTHAGMHVAAALDPLGGLPGVREFPAAATGYAGLLSWLSGFGTVALAGVEGTGSYGAGLARYLAAAGIRVVEVDRPFVVVDPQAHRDMPSRRLASLAGTNVVWPAASRAFHSSTAAVSSASSRSSTVAACCRALRRRKSVTGTTTAAWPPRWITSYEPVSGPGVSGWAVIPLPPLVVGEGLLPIFAGFRAQRHDVGADGARVASSPPSPPPAWRHGGEGPVVTEMIEPMPAAVDLERLARDLVERARAAGDFTPGREAA